MSLFFGLVHISKNGKFPIHSVFKLVVKLLHRSKYKQEKTGKLLSTEISAQSQWNTYEGMLNKLNGFHSTMSISRISVIATSQIPMES